MKTTRWTTRRRWRAHGAADRLHAGVKAELPMFSGSVQNFMNRLEFELVAWARAQTPDGH